MGIYGKLAPPAEKISPDSLHWFDQSPFFGANNNLTGLNDTGVVYVPKACKSGKKCALHLSLHGCDVNEYFDDAVRALSFNRWAETNGIVIPWPHLKPHGGENPTEEQKIGCYDAYAQTGADYATQR